MELFPGINQENEKTSGLRLKSQIKSRTLQPIGAHNLTPTTGHTKARMLLIVYANIHTHSHILYADGYIDCIYGSAKS